GVRRAGRSLDVRPAAGTGIDQLLVLKKAQCGFIEGQAIALKNRAFVPVQSEPAQIIESALSRAWLDSRRVNVFDAQHDAAGAAARGQPGNQVSPGIADVLRPGRRRRQTADDTRVMSNE